MITLADPRKPKKPQVGVPKRSSGEPGEPERSEGPPREANPLARRVAELERDKRKLEKRLEEARIIIEFQKKIAEVLGIPLKKPENDEAES